jgi:hypothetical protein
MREAKQLTNDELALHLELWTMMNSELTTQQTSYFDEIVWRLLMLPDKEKENQNEQGK